MQPNPRGRLIVPLLIIAVGTGWLLSALGIGQGIDWVWTLGLGIIGILAFVVSGFNKFSVAVGSFFLLASILSILRQTGRISPEVEIPVLIISVGVLLLVAQWRVIPLPRWIVPQNSSPGPQRERAELSPPTTPPPTIPPPIGRPADTR